MVWEEVAKREMNFRCRKIFAMMLSMMLLFRDNWLVWTVLVGWVCLGCGFIGEESMSVWNRGWKRIEGTLRCGV